MKKTVIFVLLIVIFTLAVLGAYKLITDKKDGEPLHAADPASGLKNQPVSAPVVTVADEPNIRRGNPYDNALAENFFSILKTECIYRTKIATFSEAKELIDDYIYFYNNQRIQTKTKLTPLEKRCQYVA
ncbi:MAG: IS3 family transposase [Eubacteriales bacterium]|nr:IS3 family transposase [Eubacteriales bacterium]